jgi:hypothetical protein
LALPWIAVQRSSLQYTPAATIFEPSRNLLQVKKYALIPPSNFLSILKTLQQLELNATREWVQHFSARQPTFQDILTNGASAVKKVMKAFTKRERLEE